MSGRSIRPLKHNGRKGKVALPCARQKKEFPVGTYDHDMIPEYMGIHREQPSSSLSSAQTNMEIPVIPSSETPLNHKTNM